MVLTQNELVGALQHEVNILQHLCTKIDPSIATQLELPSYDGALVTDVQPDSPAAKAGFQPQDVVVEFAGSKIRTPAQ